jgi:exopolysaccharide biosynthesis predicted pyruvyltransferase EpsI
MKEETTDNLHASVVAALATLEISVLTNRKNKHQSQQDVEVPFMRLITDVRVTSPQRRRN